MFSQYRIDNIDDFEENMFFLIEHNREYSQYVHKAIEIIVPIL